MDFARAFAFIFEDIDWIKKILLVSLVGLIPIIGQIFLLGWGLEVARRVISRDYTVLPDLDFGPNLSRGFQAAIVALVYALPIILVTIPYVAIMASLDNNSELGPLGLITVLCFTGFTLIYALFLEFILPAAFGNMVAKGQMSAGLRFGEVFGLVRAAPTSYLIAMLGMILSGLVAGLGSVACLIGVVVTLTYSYAVNGHFIGQAYRDATRR